MTEGAFPALDTDAIRGTRAALHAWSRILGGWLKQSRARRKHWWHASLRPSITGLSTGVDRADVDFELELDFVSSRRRSVARSRRRPAGRRGVSGLRGRPVFLNIARRLVGHLRRNGRQHGLGVPRAQHVRLVVAGRGYRMQFEQPPGERSDMMIFPQSSWPEDREKLIRGHASA